MGLEGQEPPHNITRQCESLSALPPGTRMREEVGVLSRVRSMTQVQLHPMPVGKNNRRSPRGIFPL